MLRGEVGVIEYALSKTNKERDSEPIYSFRLINRQTIGLDAIAQAIAESTSLNAVDVKTVIEALPTQIIQHLASGRTVELGELGSIMPTLTGGTTDPNQTLNNNNTDQLKVVFRFKQTILSQLRGLVSFNRVTDPVVPIITSLFDVNANHYDVGAVGHTLRLRGERLNIDKTKNEEGVFIGDVRAEIYPRIGKTWLEAIIPATVTFPASVEVRAAYGSNTLRIGIGETELSAA